MLSAVSTLLLISLTTLLSITVWTPPLTTVLVFSMPSCTAPRVLSVTSLRVEETDSLAPFMVPPTASLAPVTASLALVTILKRRTPLELCLGSSTVKRLIASKIKAFVYIIYVQVSYRSEYTPHIFVNILLYLFM